MAKLSKQQLGVLIFGILLIIVAVGTAVFLRAQEDSWVCENGEWVEHGNPRITKPTTPCANSTNATNENQNINAASLVNESVMNPTGSTNAVTNGNVNTNTTTTPQLQKISVYFSNNNLDPEITCTKVFAVERVIPKTEAVASAALKELLNGPTQNEAAQGFYSNLNPASKVQSINIKDGVASVDFSEDLNQQTGGSCKVSAIRAQITDTLKQFSTVQTVVISVNGEAEEVLQP